MGIGGKLVVAGPLRDRDSFCKSVGRQLDLADHSQSPSGDRLSAAEIGPSFIVTSLTCQLAGLAGYVCGIAPDRSGQFGQPVHALSVGHVRWSADTLECCHSITD